MLSLRAPPDGQTLLMIAPSSTINVTLYDKLNFNFVHDIAPVATLTRQAQVMVVNPSFPAKTVPEFIAYAKDNPGKINMASGGTGTGQHLTGELFKMMTGIDMMHVPYRGGAPAITDLIRGTSPGHVHLAARYDRVHQGWQAARAGGDNGDPLGGSAGRAACGRFRAGLRGDQLVRDRRSHEDAHRDCRQAQQFSRIGPQKAAVDMAAAVVVTVVGSPVGTVAGLAAASVAVGLGVVASGVVRLAVSAAGLVVSAEPRLVAGSAELDSTASAAEASASPAFAAGAFPSQQV